MMNIELPKDAEGREIPLDTKVLYNSDGDAYEIACYVYTVRQTISRRIWDVKMLDGTIRYTTSLYLTPPDSWEKLEEDLDRCIKADSLCAYSPSEECSTCVLPRDSQCNCDSFALEAIKERIRKLRGESDA
jgi:hypothetical protein